MPEGQLEEGSVLSERYRIIRVIGQGGMGTVYQAEHVRLNSILAVKEIRGVPVPGTTQQATMQQYEQEARFLVRLNHPNLPKVTDAFVEGDRFYLVMDFVEGATLDACLRMRRGKPLDADTVVNLSIEIADVLHYLHSQSPPIIFRDLKPSNIMVQPDKHIKLIDFGIARRFQPGASQDTFQLGSVGYSPPEQFGKHQTDKRSDIYALGATMHHLLTNRDPSISPFKFVPVEQVARGIPNSLSQLIAKCVAMEPDQRPSDAGAVSAELHSIRDLLNKVKVPLNRGARADTVPAITVRAPAIGTPHKSWMQGPRRVYSANAVSGHHHTPASSRLRFAFLALLMVFAFGAAAVSVNNGSRPVKAKKHVTRNVRIHSPSTRRSLAQSPTTWQSTENSSAPTDGGNGETDPDARTASETDQQSAEGSSTSLQAVAKTARCSAEVLSTSSDGTSLRLHITGEINGRKDASGKVAAYFYRADKRPLPSRYPNGAYATPSGQLFAEFTFQIDADSQSIDGVIEVPADQFTSTDNLLVKCIIYADDQSAAQTGFIRCSSDTSVSSVMD
jgi:serine/threonine protein kinase